MAGLAVGYVVGIFIAVRFLDHPAVPFVVGAIGATVGVVWLLRSAAGGRPMTLRRVVAWVLLVLATAFMVMLAIAIATFE
jgi:hypothetical protein